MTVLKNHGLLIANLSLFVIFFVGMIVTGAAAYSQEQLEHGSSAVSALQYLGTGDFVEATFENWESEFLQMGMYVVLTIFLFQRGSAESKELDKPAPQDEDPRTVEHNSSTPWPVRRGGLVLVLYENSLALLFAALFIASFLLHAAGGADAYSEDQVAHGGAAVNMWQFMATSEFWFQSFQNWQSEFMVVAVFIGASIFLRQRGSSQSKPVADPHYETNA
jgi:hypothetical protein